MGMSKDITVQEDTNDASMRPSNMTDNDQSNSYMMQVCADDVMAFYLSIIHHHYDCCHLQSACWQY